MAQDVRAADRRGRMTGAFTNVGPAMVAAVVFLLLVTWCFSHRRVDQSLAALGLYLGLLDGYLKLSTGSPVITLARDVLVAAIAGGALLRAMNSHKQLPLPPIGGLVLAFSAVAFIELFNPDAPDLIVGAAGVRQHLEFVPLFFLGFAFMRRESQVQKLLFILLLCAAAGGVVSYIQSTLTPEQFAQWGPGYSERILGTGAFAGAPRVAFGDRCPVGTTVRAGVGPRRRRRRRSTRAACAHRDDDRGEARSAHLARAAGNGHRPGDRDVRHSRGACDRLRLDDGVWSPRRRFAQRPTRHRGTRHRCDPRLRRL